MKLPDSIEQLTEERQGDSLVTRTVIADVDIDDIIYSIRQKLPLHSRKHFDEGLVFYKSTGGDRELIRSLMGLFQDNVIKSIQQSAIDDTQRVAIIELQKTVITNIATILEAQLKLLSTLNKNKNIIDAEAISYILLGYATDTIKKINNSKQQNSRSNVE